jgi:hypothetical protein
VDSGGNGSDSPESGRVLPAAIVDGCAKERLIPIVHPTNHYHHLFQILLIDDVWCALLTGHGGSPKESHG